MDTLILNSNGLPTSYVPLSTINWQSAMRQIYLGKVKVLKEYDDWVIRSQHLTLYVPSIVIMTNHVKWAKGIKYSRSNVFIRDDYTCQLQTTWRCREAHGKVKPTDLTIDHVIPKSHGGKTSWTNVTTSCKECNGDKGSDHTILPKKAPYKPTYHELLNKRKTMPLYIRDPAWAYYIDWPAHLIKVTPPV